MDLDQGAGWLNKEAAAASSLCAPSQRVSPPRFLHPYNRTVHGGPRKLDRHRIRPKYSQHLTQSRSVFPSWILRMSMLFLGMAAAGKRWLPNFVILILPVGKVSDADLRIEGQALRPVPRMA